MKEVNEEAMNEDQEPPSAEEQLCIQGTEIHTLPTGLAFLYPRPQISLIKALYC